MNSICTIILVVLFVIAAKKINGSCVHNDKDMECRCSGNEEISFPENFNYESLLYILITSCVSVNVDSLSIGHGRMFREIVIKNISDNLTFEPILSSKKIDVFQLTHIKKIPKIYHETFTSLSVIDSFIIEDTRIEEFDEQFTNINVTSFVLQNVTIDHSVGINFSSEGTSLKIINSVLRNVNGNFNFAFFGSIELINSTFELERPGDMAIDGHNVIINGCVFTNVSMNLVARGKAVIKRNCADGKSSLRVSSISVNSYGNKLPTEIVYAEKVTKSSMFYDKNNLVCIAGDCKCPKSAGHNSFDKLHANIYLGIVLLVILHGL